MSDTIPVIRLCKGAGNGDDEACLVTAAAMIAGKPEALDGPSCVCPVIRGAGIAINDSMTDAARSRWLGDLPWQIVGTRADFQTERRRVEYALKRCAATRLIHGPHLRSIYKLARRCLAADHLRAAGSHVGRLAIEIGKRRGQDALPREIILGMCAIGGTTPIEPAYTQKELAAKLGQVTSPAAL